MDRDNLEERKAMFDYWLSLSIKYGRWNYFEDIDGSRYVFIDGGSKEKFIDVWNRGWTVEYLAGKIPCQEIHKLVTPDVNEIRRLSPKAFRSL